MSLIGLSNEAQTKRRTALDLEQKALADLREEARKKGEKDLESIQLSPDKIAAIEQESAAYARQSEALRQAQEQQQKLNEWNNVARDATRGFIDDLIQGESAADAFAGALSRIADALLDDVLNSIFKVNNAAGGSGGLLSGLFSLFGGGASRYAGLSGGLFSEGGFTGPGGKYQPAGIVHKGEVVWSQSDVARAGGVGAVEALRKGYANGGPVGISVPSVPSLRSMSAQSAGVVVNFNPVVDNRGASVEAVARQEKALAKMQGELQSRVEAAVRSAQKRNVKLG
nr:phage tail protein [Rhizobium sp. P007]